MATNFSISLRGRVSQRPAAIATVFCVLLTSALSIVVPAKAQDRLEAQYRVTMTGVPVGTINWQVDFQNNLYATSASGGASRVLSLLVNGQGQIASNGTIVDGHLVPKQFTSNIIDEDGDTELMVSFVDGVATESVVKGPAKRPPLTPIYDADRRGVIDPLSALLIANGIPGALPSKSCHQALPIFDGQRRYNLVLTYQRMDKVKLDHGYAGPVLVCGATLAPIGGYRVDSMIVKYVAARRDIELWLAPVAGMPFLAPVELSVPTLIGTLSIQAERFESIGRR